MELNSSQRKAINKIDGPCLVLAGPGSGKTAVITRRTIELINKGIPSEEILVITFTKAAAMEMNERFDRLSDAFYPVTFVTFHSLFFGILQKELKLKPSDILMGNAKNKLLKSAMEQAGINAEDSILMNAFATELSAFNNSSCEIDEYNAKFVDKSELISLSKSYESLKDKYRLIDFDDMLTKTYKLFKSNEDVLKKWQARYSYFLVDEMQDMNNIQFQLMQMISARTNNIFCVGDDDQSIYGFRGANPSLMQSFLDVYTNAERILLNYNYRNPSNIVGCAANLISQNKTRFEKEILTIAGVGGLFISEYRDESKEAEGVIDKINSLRENGTPLDEIAILYRNHSDARFIVDSLINSKIPFYLKEKMPNIYSHFIISDIEAYFQIAIGNSTKSRLLNIINRPNRYLHRRSVEIGGDLRGMLRFYEDNRACYNAVEGLIRDFNLISKMSPAAAINYIKNAMGYDNFLKEEALAKQCSYNDYREILDFLTQTFKDCRTIRQSIDKLNELRLKIDYENKNQTVDRAGKIGLYTLHSSKGLEFDNVFIISANEGVMPTSKVEKGEELEAERRLFYVGITRTKKNLYISYTNQKNRDKSRFIDEMGYSSNSSSSSSISSSNLAVTAAYSSSSSMLSRDGAPVSSSK